MRCHIVKIHSSTLLFQQFCRLGKDHDPVLACLIYQVNKRYIWYTCPDRGKTPRSRYQIYYSKVPYCLSESISFDAVNKCWVYLTVCYWRPSIFNHRWWLICVWTRIKVWLTLWFLQVEENTATSMKKLIEIDSVKVRMQDSCNALQVRKEQQIIYLCNDYY